MSTTLHRLFIATLVLIVASTFIILLYIGNSYYQTGIEDRFFHPSHQMLKPSGIWGHGLGIIGTLIMIIGMLMYMLRKRMKVMARWGSLKVWLELHIFLCTLGPMMVLFHTSFKFGGIVSVSFWSMVAVFLSGFIGRFIYIQIPRSIEGRELSLNEIRESRIDLAEILKNEYQINKETSQAILSAISGNTDNNNGNNKRYLGRFKTIRLVKNLLRENKIPNNVLQQLITLIKKDIVLSRKIERLATMQKLFNYWHVAHLPFALVMLIIMVIHVAVTIIFGYKWIF